MIQYVFPFAAAPNFPKCLMIFRGPLFALGVDEVDSLRIT